MFLRSLTIRGFKSFAERTRLHFTPGISVIVGPNGSGKSNIVDAISWVLGEQGPRALRGGQMADVIFAGSPGRPPLGMAEVKLTIDNSSGIIPVPMTELEISRAIFRSGESEYRIGGQVCRLLDIQELLSETGIGRALHTVVGQGQLEDALTARPEERRQYVEEAAGIAKHRRRKERAQRKLAALEQDLVRLQDVLAELKRQLRPLRQQAEMAGRHERLTKEAEDAAWRLAAARLRALQEERESRSGGWQEGLALREEARARVQELDEELAALAARREQTARALHEAELEAERASAHRASAERDARSAVDRVMQARARLARAQADSGRVQGVDRDIARLEEAHRETLRLLERRERELQAAEAAFHAKEVARREAEDERHRRAEEVVAHRAEMEALQRSLASADRERERLETSLADVGGRIAAGVDERERLEAEIERLDAQETPLAQRQSQLERERDAMSTELRDLEDRISGLEHRRALLQARRDDLESTPGARFLERHRGRAVGLVRELVRAEPGMERALWAALGPLADAVVYEDPDRALDDARDGAGTAIGISAPGAIGPSLPGERPLLGSVHVDPRARAFLAAALRDVYVAEGIADAAARSRRHPRCSFVSPEGVLVGPSLIRTAADPGAQIDRLRAEMAAVDGELEGVRKARQRVAARLERVMADIAAVRTELEAADGAITAAAERMGRLSAEAAGLAREEALLGERLAGVEDAQAAWRASLAQASGPQVDLPPLPPLPEPPVDLRVDVEALRRDARRTDAAVGELRAEREALAASDPRAIETEVTEAEGARRVAEEEVAAAEERVERTATARSAAAAEDRGVADAEAEANRTWRERAAALERLREEYEQEDRTRADLERRIGEAERLLQEGHGREPAEAVAALSEDETTEVLERRGELVARRLALLGRVNLLAQGEYRSMQERHDFLVRELDDVKAARRDLFEVVRQVDERIVTLFEEAFRDVAREFEQLFSGLFPGGEGRLVLTEPDDPLATGIELEARPGRKRVKRISLLSGGERALTALAFLFAIFRARPSPFYLLDEVEAALDDINLHRFLGLIQGFAERSQVLLITHQKRTMEVADVLYGVSMRRDGSSAVVAQRLEDTGGTAAREDQDQSVIRVPASEDVPAPRETDPVH
jgi:chromosome segregation protein